MAKRVTIGNLPVLGYDEIAGSLPWSESGLVLLAKIRSEIESAGGADNLLLKIREEKFRFQKAPARKRGIKSKKIWTDKESEFLKENWHKLRIFELCVALDASIDTIRKHAFEVLHLPHKNSVAA